MKTLFRWIIRTLLALLALLVIFIVVLVAANWQDEPLTPEAARLLAPPESLLSPSSDEPNAYYVWLSMSYAPDDEDALTAGKRLHDEYSRQFRENPTVEKDDSDQSHSKKIADAIADIEKFHCDQTDCADFYLSEKDDIQNLLAKQAVLRQRYLQFSQIPAFDESVWRVMGEPHPNFILLGNVAEMRLMEAVLTLDKGNLQTGADILMEQIRVHRRILAGSSQPLTKLTGITLLYHDYDVLSNAIEHWPTLARQAALTEAWQPLSEQELDMRRVIELEAAFNINTLHTVFPKQLGLSPVKERMLRTVYLPNATINTIARWANEDIQSLEGNAATDEALHQAHIAKRKEEMSRIDHYSWRSIRNPVGKILLLIVYHSPGIFYEGDSKLHKLDGYIRLVALQAALRRDNVPPNKIADYIQHTAPDLRNPYDGQPMRWDATTSTLSFEGRQENNANPSDAPKTFSVQLRAPQASGQ